MEKENDPLIVRILIYSTVYFLESRGSVVTTELCYHVMQNIVDVHIKFSG